MLYAPPSRYYRAGRSPKVRSAVINQWYLVLSVWYVMPGRVHLSLKGNSSSTTQHNSGMGFTSLVTTSLTSFSVSLFPLFFLSSSLLSLSISSSSSLLPLSPLQPKHPQNHNPHPVVNPQSGRADIFSCPAIAQSPNRPRSPPPKSSPQRLFSPGFERLFPTKTDIISPLLSHPGLHASRSAPALLVLPASLRSYGRNGPFLRVFPVARFVL